MCIWWSVARPSAQTLNPKPNAPDTPLNQTKTTKPATRTQPEPGRQPSKRGVGLSFGPDVTEKFLARNNLKMVVRSHEVGGSVDRMNRSFCLGQSCCGRRDMGLLNHAASCSKI